MIHVTVNAKRKNFLNVTSRVNGEMKMGGKIND